MQTIYLISGPLGAGKTTVSKNLANVLPNCALIEGDTLYNLPSEVDLEWKEKLKKGWTRIISLAQKYLNHGYQNVVIDFVVEDELSWFRQQLTNFDIGIEYIVLTADKETITERLRSRGELKYQERSFFLLAKLINSEENKSHLLDTTNMNVDEIVHRITANLDTYSLS